MQNSVIVLFNGYSNIVGKNAMLANSTCTLIKGKSTCTIVDTRTAWDGDEIIKELAKHNINTDQITNVVCTHGHSDHIGCNFLFLNAKEHIIGHSISFKDTYRFHNFTEEDYQIDEDIWITATPGHTLDSVSVIVDNTDLGKRISICGDLFEKAEDCANANIWIEAGTESMELQRKHRHRMVECADIIIPGHGPMFEVTQEIIQKLKNELNE